ncbi:MAG: glycine reductase [Firmicutes bacterium]|nr:glycine reductase [Bacillota bacterium]
MSFPVIKGVSYMLTHTPDLVRYGSKPTREFLTDPLLQKRINENLRSYVEAKNYPPHQVYIGNMKPEDLWQIEQPWFENLHEDASRFGPWGEIMPQDEFYGYLKIVDEFDLVFLTASFTEQVRSSLEKHRLFTADDNKRLGSGVEIGLLEEKISAGALPLYDRGSLIGCIQDGHDEDENLKAHILLENLSCKATGVLAMRNAFHLLQIDPASIDYAMNSGEEGVGDRYQRGAGNLAKAMAEMSGCINSSGSDIKAFCCGPVHTMVLAGSLVQSGIFENVVVIGGGCLAKLGMKMRGHLSNSMPILEDILAAFVVVIGPDDGINPQIRLDVIGKHDVGAGSSQQAIYESLVKKPLDKIGLTIPDIDKYSTELHNPEITEPAGSGNVPKNNYRMIGGLAVMQGQLPREELDQFEKIHGMPGYSPTQGHIPSALPYLGQACKSIMEGEISRTMFVGKGSLFLAKMTNMSDGISFIIEKNSKAKVIG